MHCKLWISALALGLAVALCPPAIAANASLVADIHSGVPPTGRPGAGPSQLTPIGDRMVFTAEEASSGEELWVTDGSPQGTLLLRDICPGTCSSSPQLFATAAGPVFVFAYGADSGELWRTDGTRAGTVHLAKLPSLPPTYPNQLLAVSSHAVFFVACDQAACEPWTSDGTPSGTGRIVDLQPGGSSSNPSSFRVMGETLYFVAQTETGRGLWRSDGTAAGTSLVRDRLDGSGVQVDVRLTVAADRLFFVAEDNGLELWTSDGTPAGTRPLTSFAAASPRFGPFEASGDLVHFTGDDVVGGNDLWQSDGTPAGTHRVTDFGYAFPFSFDFGPANMERVAGHLLFVASDGLSGSRLWTSDGAPTSTRPLPGCGVACSTPDNPHDFRLWRLGQQVVWFAYDGSGMSLWSSDGTEARKVRDLCAGGCGPTNANVAIADGSLYFVTYVFSSPARYLLWRSDGTTAGTMVLSETSHPRFFGDEAALHVVAGAPGHMFAVSDSYGNELWKAGATSAEAIFRFYVGEASSNPTSLQPFGDQVLFAACDGDERALWLSGAATATTHKVPGPWYGCGDDSPEAAVVGGLAFFVQLIEGPYDWQLWRTDGSGAGTVHLASFGYEPSTAGSLVAHAGKLVFAVKSADRVELWTSDGTVPGTRLIVDLGTEVRELSALTSTGPDLYFVASATENGTRSQVWRSDGTPGGTRPVTNFTDPYPFSTASPRFTRLGDTVYFLVRGALWRTKGTLASTALVPPPATDGAGTSIEGLAAFHGNLYFFAYRGPDYGLRRGLWRSDGTTAGTTFLAEGAPVRFPTVDAIALVAGDAALYYAADDGEHGEELWVSDGTAAGTRMVRDILPGGTSSLPGSLTLVGGRLFFSASDGEHGFELWESDGSAGGTRMVQDIAPGSQSSSPLELVAAGGSLFFSADDGVWGRELWALPLAAGSCEPGTFALCLGGGRYKVEARWADFSGNRGAGHAVALTADTGYFWFFGPENVEVVLKVLDGRGLNDHVWVFYGALSSVEYALTVTDTATGAARRYVNPKGRLGSVADTAAFGPRGATPSALSFGPTPRPSIAAPARRSSTTAAPCVPSSTRLCLNGGRFAVEARWSIPTGNGVGQAVPLTGDTGYLWFFGPDNVELVVKVLDGRPVNGKFWVFYGALSDVSYTLTVTDTQTGAVREYPNPGGRLASVADTGAF